MMSFDIMSFMACHVMSCVCDMSYEVTQMCDIDVNIELNNSLRKRNATDRQTMMATWGPFVHYLMKGLASLPVVSGVCYRGYPDFRKVEKHYEEGQLIQWGAFSSTTRSWDAAIGFTDQANGVIFKIKVLDGRDISKYSFFRIVR